MQDRRDEGKEICGNERSGKEGCGKVEKQERRETNKRKTKNNFISVKI